MSVTLDELKQHLRITHSAEDSLIEAYLNAALGSVSQYTGRVMVNAALVQFSACFPEKLTLSGPLVSDVEVKYQDSLNQEQTLAPSFYELVSHELRPYIKFTSEGLPELYDSEASVKVEYSAGYTDQTIPSELKAAVLLLGSHLYFHREPVVIGASVSNLPFSLRFVMDPFRVNEL